MKIGVVVSEFNREVTQELEKGALEYLGEQGVPSESIHIVHVPGAYEIPLVAKVLLKNDYDGVIALGAVIRGETSHYDYVCSSVERGCSSLQLKYEKPVVFGVLTTENEEQAFDRLGGKHGHKGRDAGEVLLGMLETLESLKRNIKSHKKSSRESEKRKSKSKR